MASTKSSSSSATAGNFYSSLTPASSTTSLNDAPGLTLLGGAHSLQHARWADRSLSASSLIGLNDTAISCNTTTLASAANTSISSTTSTASSQTKKRVRTSLAPTSSSTLNLTTVPAAVAVPRRRGRPPKNQSALTAAAIADTIANVAIGATHEATAQQQQHVHVHVPAKLATSSAPRKSTSNLQRSKVVMQPPAAPAAAADIMPPPARPPAQQQQQQQQQMSKEQSDRELMSRDAVLFYERYDAAKSDALTQRLHAFHNEQHNADAAATSAPACPMPALNWADSESLWAAMRLKDAEYAHDSQYMRRHEGIEPTMRSILIDWLVEIAHAYRLHRETLHLAVEYMDRFMSVVRGPPMRVDRLQLVGITALFLAAKVEEIYPPKLKDFATHLEDYSHDNEDAIQQFELFMLKSLAWQISPVTANTWLMTYLQIGALNYHDFISDTKCTSTKQPYNAHVVMPLNIYKNSQASASLRDYLLTSADSKRESSKFSAAQQAFYMHNYMRSVTLLDLCMFDIDSLRFDYSILAATALCHMIALPGGAHCDMGLVDKAQLVQQCTGFRLHELDTCIKWMHPYADVCKEILTDERMIRVKQLSNVDADDAHNIQVYYQNLELLKEAQSRKTPCKFNMHSSAAVAVVLTPPDSRRKNNHAASSSSSCSPSSSSSSSSSSNLY